MNQKGAPSDPYDLAYTWGWSQPHLREIIYRCYKTPNFEENARRYFMSPEFHEAVRILSELGKSPHKGMKVLDFGCGNGVACYALARIGYSVVGVDSSLGELAGINAAKKIQGLDGVFFELVHTKGEKIDFPDNSFDIVWIREALHHIMNLVDFLTEIKRVLKPDGIVCCLRDVVIWNESQRAHFFATHPFNHITKDEGCYYLEEYLSAFDKAGLSIEKVLYPHASIINTYPDTPNNVLAFDEDLSKQRKQGYDLFSFFARKCETQNSEIQTGSNFESCSAKNMHVVSLRSTFNHAKNFFGPVILNPETLARIAADSSTWQEILLFHSLLATDEYVKYLDVFYRECIKRFGSKWYYLDIVNVLYAASKTIQPRNYLEIGVRRGRSVCVVARACPSVNITAFDMWIQGYAGMDNPGPEFVRAELSKHGHTGNISFIDGDSHQTIPFYFKQYPGATFDLITVDGDHSEAGAFDDLKNVIPHLSVGGILVFDDIAHPSHPYLLNVWRKAILTFPYLTSFEYTEMGYGVAFAIRKNL